MKIVYFKLTKKKSGPSRTHPQKWAKDELTMTWPVFQYVMVGKIRAEWENTGYFRAQSEKKGFPDR